jgi:hypothetical protein
MPAVRAAKVTDIRGEFDRRYIVIEADPTKAMNAKRMAFKRAIDNLSPAQFGAGSAESQTGYGNSSKGTRRRIK